MHSWSSSISFLSSALRRLASLAPGRRLSSPFSARAARSSSWSCSTCLRSSSIVCWLSAYQRSFSRRSLASASAFCRAENASATWAAVCVSAAAACCAGGPVRISRSIRRFSSRQRSSSRAFSSQRSLASFSSRSSSPTLRMLAGFASADDFAWFSSATSWSWRPSTSSLFSRMVCRSWRFCAARLSFSFSQPRSIRSVSSSSRCGRLPPSSPSPSAADAAGRAPAAAEAICRSETSSRSMSRSSTSPAFSSSRAATRLASASRLPSMKATSLRPPAVLFASSSSAASARCSRSRREASCSRCAAAQVAALASRESCCLLRSRRSRMTFSSSWTVSCSARAFAATRSALYSSSSATLVRS
mmetsp:Transcript_13836/g.29983  ORF Transcript_13836/g.29983 Transcript_13836/m.29983 type:complete len:360 (-) Transcript_13836:314-1393(-)